MSSALPAVEQPSTQHGRLGSQSRAGGDSRLARWAPLLAGVCTAVLLAATLEVVLDGATGHSPLIPKSPQIAGWLGALGARLSFQVFLVALLAFTAAYAGMLGLSRWLSARWVLGLVAVLHLIVFVGPILFSTDVFSYIAYARMGVEHGINPYLHGPSAIIHDPVYRYVGQSWKHVQTAYGPLYTLISYPLAPLGVTGALWGMKLMGLAASAGTLALTWRCARIRGLSPSFAVLAVGVNPLYILYGFGGAHNDLILMLAMMAAVSLTLAGRDAPAAAAVVGGMLVKATGAVLLPFMILGRRQVGAIVGGAGAMLGAAVVAYTVFGVHGVDLIAALNRNAAFVSTDSFPTEIAHLFGKPGVFPIDHTLLKAALVVIVLHLMWRTWRGYDWVAASGWTLLAISVTSTWLLAWYIVWSLPLAVVTRDRRLLAATLAIQALFIAHQVSPLFVQVR
ncbi:MAG TPA: polyprenol phosphomannose-dependent alpha 1,6 mannosyltransferase MptB [Solirubrobacteraceae bacterium]|nr:polyprenol phosphomannose-dependent alpha 1,6 mannosyltransferase MptB [Solirubrobacteraceae bacterium]